MILETRNLRAFFGTFRAVNGVSLQVPEHAVMALIGPSGCGKSTFLRTLNRMHEEIPGARVEGDVILQGQNIYGRDPQGRKVNPVDVRRRIGMVFQRPNPFPSMTVFENVVAGLMLAGVRDRRALEEVAEQSLKQAALWEETKDLLQKPGTALSGGQQQRLCIARALAVKPPILLMDEPTSALDPISTAKIEELVVELKKEVTIVMVTHNMQQASRISDLTSFFLLGDLVETGSTEQIFTVPKDPRTEQYITGRFG
jgi:phosphate transport system ATP-binding protein